MNYHSNYFKGRTSFIKLFLRLVINGMVYWITKKRAAKELAIKDKIVCILSLAEKVSY